jgi:hypothetical protein
MNDELPSFCGLPMADVRVGMRLRTTVTAPCDEEIEVTRITDRGFDYRIPDDMPLVHPHWSIKVERNGREHYGWKGYALYRPIAPPGVPPLTSPHA